MAQRTELEAPFDDVLLIESGRPSASRRSWSSPAAQLDGVRVRPSRYATRCLAQSLRKRAKFGGCVVRRRPTAPSTSPQDALGRLQYVLVLHAADGLAGGSTRPSRRRRRSGHDEDEAQLEAALH